MSKAEVKGLIDETQKQLAHYLNELAEGRSFDMGGFEQIALKIQKEITALSVQEMATFKDSLTKLMSMLDQLQAGLEAKRRSVKSEIEGLNKQLTANKAYRQTDENK